MRNNPHGAAPPISSTPQLTHRQQIAPDLTGTGGQVAATPPGGISAPPAGDPHIARKAVGGVQAGPPTVDPSPQVTPSPPPAVGTIGVGNTTYGTQITLQQYLNSDLAGSPGTWQGAPPTAGVSPPSDPGSRIAGGQSAAPQASPLPSGYTGNSSPPPASRVDFFPITSSAISSPPGYSGGGPALVRAAASGDPSVVSLPSSNPPGPSPGLPSPPAARSSAGVMVAPPQNDPSVAPQNQAPAPSQNRLSPSQPFQVSAPPQNELASLQPNQAPAPIRNPNPPVVSLAESATPPTPSQSSQNIPTPSNFSPAPSPDLPKSRIDFSTSELPSSKPSQSIQTPAPSYTNSPVIATKYSSDSITFQPSPSGVSNQSPQSSLPSNPPAIMPKPASSADSQAPLSSSQTQEQSAAMPLPDPPRSPMSNTVPAAAWQNAPNQSQPAPSTMSAAGSAPQSPVSLSGSESSATLQARSPAATQPVVQASYPSGNSPQIISRSESVSATVGNLNPPTQPFENPKAPSTSSAPLLQGLISGNAFSQIPADRAALNLIGSLQPVPPKDLMSETPKPEQNLNLNSLPGLQQENAPSSAFGAAQSVLAKLGAISQSIQQGQFQIANQGVSGAKAAFQDSGGSLGSHGLLSTTPANGVPNLIGAQSQLPMPGQMNPNLDGGRSNFMAPSIASQELRNYQAAQQSKREGSKMRAFVMGGLAVLSLGAVVMFTSDIHTGGLIAAFGTAIACGSAVYSWINPKKL